MKSVSYKKGTVNDSNSASIQMPGETRTGQTSLVQNVIQAYFRGEVHPSFTLTILALEPELVITGIPIIVITLQSA